MGNINSPEPNEPMGSRGATTNLQKAHPIAFGSHFSSSTKALLDNNFSLSN